MRARAGAVYTQAGSAAGLNGGCVLQSSVSSKHPACGSRHQPRSVLPGRAPALGLPQGADETGTGTWLGGWGAALQRGAAAKPPKGGGDGKVGGQPPPPPPPCAASCANEEPPPGTAVSVGPCDLAGGRERKRPAAPPACKLLPHAGGRSRRGQDHVSPFPPHGDAAFAGLGSPQRCSSEHQCRSTALIALGSHPERGAAGMLPEQHRSRSSPGSRAWQPHGVP